MTAPTPPDSPPDPGSPTEVAAEPLPKMPSTAGWWIGGALLALGIIGGMVLTGVGFGRLIESTVGDNVSVGSTRTLSLDKGTYTVKVDDYYSSYGINPKVSVRAPNGTETDVTANAEVYHEQTYYSSKNLGDFDATENGNYVVRVERRPDVSPRDPFDPLDPPTSTQRGTSTTRSRTTSTTNYFSGYGQGYPTRVKVARADNEVASVALPTILGGIFGGLLLVIVGAIVMIMTGTRRGRAKRARQPVRAPAFASYPPPAFAGGPGYAPPPPGGPYGGPPPGGPYGAPPPGGPYGAPPPGGPYGGPPPGGPPPGGPYGAPPPGRGYGPPGPPPPAGGPYPYPPPAGYPGPAAAPSPGPGPSPFAPPGGPPSSPQPGAPAGEAADGPPPDDDDDSGGYGRGAFPDPTRPS